MFGAVIRGQDGFENMATVHDIGYSEKTYFGDVYVTCHLFLHEFIHLLK